MTNNIIVRVQSPDHGTRRIQTKATDRIGDFFQKVRTEFELDNSEWKLFSDRGKTSEIKLSKSKTLSSQKIKHGDLLYLSTDTRNAPDVDSGERPSPLFAFNASASAIQPSTSATTSTKSTSISVVEDEVDRILDKQDGRIFRERNEQLCRHGPGGRCLHCVPLEPYDQQYLSSVDPPIKFLSFHSYIRELTGGVDKGKFVYLENLSCKIKPGCKEHPPWPKGICTKCQPNAVTLNRQKYRHVDYIQFENPFLMERFLNYWRSTGCQRLGYLYGYYEPHKDMPLGIKAVVAAIYEPPQKSSKSSVELEEDEREEVVEQVARGLGMRRVGWIFTDLVAEDLQKGTVKHFRGHVNSHFLSAEECIMAAYFQNKHPHQCKLSPEGHFGSKFVTVVVTGDASNQIHFEGYQVSNQCMALVNDDCLVPTRDAPELGYVKESSNEQYVPDVFFKEKDSYGNEVIQLARPLPVEYLLVDLPAAFPVEPLFTFHAGSDVKPFPMQNRAVGTGELQDFNSFTQYLEQFPRDKFLQAVSDFHLLVFMASCDMLPLKSQMGDLLKAVKTKNEEMAHHWRKQEEWATVEELMAANTPSPSASRQTSHSGDSGASHIAGAVPGLSGTGWSCAHCTFTNQPTTASCEMCGLPK